VQKPAGKEGAVDTTCLRTEVASAITRTLDRRRVTMRAAAAELAIDPADVQRIRNGDVERFSLDRLLRIAVRLGYAIELRLLDPAPSRGGM
jgi:predicted XRE-type DNA-binding protein